MRRSILLSSFILFFIAFLGRAQAEVPAPAKQILDTALKEASVAKKNVLVIFHATWCSWCKRLDAALATPQVKKIMDDDAVIKADATYPPDVVATGVSLAVLGVRGRTFEGFYQKKLPLRMILPSELITKENAKAYYVPGAAF